MRRARDVERAGALGMSSGSCALASIEEAACTAIFGFSLRSAVCSAAGVEEETATYRFFFF